MPIVTRHTYHILNEMLDRAIAGDFQESDYDETELSKLESKWMRFLGASELSRENIEKERLSLQELISDISHQAKTPIANILLYGELLAERLEGEDQDRARHLLSETKQLEFLIQSLIKVSRLEADVIQVLPEVQPVLPLLEDIEERGHKKQISRGITLEKAGWNSSVSACYDKKWTAEALYNVFDNALKYTAPESTVTVRLKEYSLFACIDIADAGPGISEDESPRLFDRFYRSPGFREEEGVGLGLYLARKILQKEGGYIKVSSKEGAGTQFSVFLRK